MQESQISTGLDWYFKKLVLTLPDKRAKDALGAWSWSADKIREEAHRVAVTLGVPIRRMDDMVSDETLTDAGSIDFFGTDDAVVADYAFAAERLPYRPDPGSRAIGAAALNARASSTRTGASCRRPQRHRHAPRLGQSGRAFAGAVAAAAGDASVAAFDAQGHAPPKKARPTRKRGNGL